MDINNLAVFSATNKNMGYLTARQRVLASNIANANTPNFLPSDVQKPSFDNELKSNLGMRVTNPKHISAVSSNIGANRIYTPQPSGDLSLDGNGVNIEDQINQVSKTRSEYNQMLNLYGKYKTMIQTANKSTGA